VTRRSNLREKSFGVFGDRVYDSFKNPSEFLTAVEAARVLPLPSVAVTVAFLNFLLGCGWAPLMDLTVEPNRTF
jgi:hypothetical protein